MALSQECILSGHLENVTTTLRQAIANSVNAVEAAGMVIPTHLQDQLLDYADGLHQVLASQLDLALAGHRHQLPAQLVLVLGMHRSGTSALSGLLVHAGLDAPSDLMPPNQPNPKGYWESVGAMQLNNQMLKDLGSEWASPKLLQNRAWELNKPAARAWRAGLLRLLHSSYPAGGCAVLKDPRLCLLLPGLTPWLESMLMSCVVFLPIRHPAEVAASLHGAQHTPRNEALILWLSHVFQAERYSRGLQRMIVDYHDLLTNPEAVLESCRQTIERAGDFNGVETCWQTDAVKFIDCQLHRQQADNEIPVWVLDEDAELWFDLSLRVYAVMGDRECIETERIDRMDQLWRQWTTLAP
jgi:hypothetical protein